MLIRNKTPRALGLDEPIRHEQTHKRPVTRRDFLAQGFTSGLATIAAPTVFSLFANPRAACAARGYDLGAFRCREIGADEFATTDLILAMDRDNLRDLEARRPEGSSARIELFLGDREVPDPYFGEADGFAVMMDQIEAGARRLLTTLGSEES